MALIKCPECDKEMSENAQVCPNCGNPNTKKQNSKNHIDDKKAGIIIVIILILVSFFGIITNSDTSNTSTKNSKTSSLMYYNIGDVVNYKDWEIKILNVDNTKQLDETMKTNNNYIVVELEMKNLQDEASSPLTTKRELTTSSYSIYTKSIFEIYAANKTYVASENLESYVDNNFNILFDKINPNTTVKYKVVFETDFTTDDKNVTFGISNSNNRIKLY